MIPPPGKKSKRLRAARSEPARFLPGVVFLPACLTATACQAAPPFPALSDIEGFWKAEPVWSEVEGSIFLEFSSMGEDSISVGLSLPAVEIDGLRLGPASILGDTVRTSIMDLTYDAETDELVTTLPGTLVPVHEIEARFRRLNARGPGFPRNPSGRGVSEDRPQG